LYNFGIAEYSEIGRGATTGRHGPSNALLRALDDNEPRLSPETGRLPNRTPMTPIYTHEIEVRFRDCDPMGHVNNAVYLTYLEQARFAHWRAAWGAEGGEAGRGLPGVILARAEIDFVRPARYGDVLEVRIRVAGVGRTSFTYEYEVVDRQGRTVAAAKSVLVMYDYEAGRPVPVPDGIRQKLEPPV
jgi:acyl-CoA thioester hydrolase